MKITALTSFCVVFFPELDKIYVGGNSLNFATQCKLLGYEDTSVIGAIGKDRFGKLIENQLDKLNINRSRLYQINEPTAINKFSLMKKETDILKTIAGMEAHLISLDYQKVIGIH